MYMQRTDKEEEGIMGKAVRILCALFALVLAGAACAPAPQEKPKGTASTAKQMVVITIDPETGEVISVQDSGSNTLKPPAAGQPQVGTLTSPTPVTITIDLKPAGSSGGVPISTPSPSPAASQATSPAPPAPGAAACRIVIINGKVYCR
jgi:hypothetical protein